MDYNDQEFLVQTIRTQYTEKEHTQLDALREQARQEGYQEGFSKGMADAVEQSKKYGGKQA